jgi:hypothetical protein
VEDVAAKKIAIRAHPTKRLHAKLYIFRPKGFNEHKPGAVITSNSHFDIDVGWLDYIPTDGAA